MFNRPRNTGSGVSPVVAVILLVAVTVTLSAVIGGFALNLGQSATSGTSSSAGVKIAQDSNSTTITVVSAESTVYYRLPNGTVQTLGGAGESVTLTEGDEYAAGESITVLTGSDGDRRVVQTVSTESQTSSSTTSTLVVDSFNDTDFSEYVGGTANFSFDSSVASDSTPSAKASVSGGESHQINSTSGLNTYPEAGDTFRVQLRWTNGSTEAHTLVLFGMQNKSNTYRAELDSHGGDGGNSEAILRRGKGGSYTKLANTSALEIEKYNKEWVTLEVKWGSSGDIQTTWYAANGSVIAQLNATDTTFTSGGIGFTCNDASFDSASATCWYDEAEVDR